MLEVHTGSRPAPAAARRRVPRHALHEPALRARPPRRRRRRCRRPSRRLGLTRRVERSRSAANLRGASHGLRTDQKLHIARQKGQEGPVQWSERTAAFGPCGKRVTRGDLLRTRGALLKRLASTRRSIPLPEPLAGGAADPLRRRRPLLSRAAGAALRARLEAALAQLAHRADVLDLGLLAGEARALEHGGQAVERRLGQERARSRPRRSRPRRSARAGRGWIRAASTESLTCSERRRSRPTSRSKLLERRRRCRRASRRRSRRRAGGRSPGRRRAARRRPAASIRPAELRRTSARACRPSRRCSRGAAGTVGRRRARALITLPARAIASPTSPFSAEPACRTTPSAPIPSPTRSECDERRSATSRAARRPRTRS